LSVIWDESRECMSRDELRALQDQRLREQVAYVYERSAFYRRKFDDIGLEPGDVRGLEDLGDLPFTTKDELRRSQAEDPPFGAHLCVLRDEVTWLPSTSGTTGIPLLLPRNDADIEVWTYLNARAFTAVGIGRGDIYQNILTYQWIYGGLALHWGAQKVGATVVNAGVGGTEKQIWALEYVGTTAFHATPSYLVHLGHQIRERGLTDKLSVKRIIAGGEVGMAGDSAKARLRDLFPSAVTLADVGGVTDIGTMIWAECPYTCGGHLAEDAVLPEILDPETKQPVPEGQVGELIFTDLVSKTAPLLRYKVNDLTRVETDRCECGRTLARIPEGILGRADDMITVRGANVYPSAMDEIVKSFGELNGQYQIIIDRPRDLDVLTLRVEVKTQLHEDELTDLSERLDSRIRFAFGGGAEVELLPPGTLPTFVYKAKRLIDKRKGETEQDAIQMSLEQQRS
jgi:phenylacetate-CoA ligase